MVSQLLALQDARLLALMAQKKPKGVAPPGPPDFRCSVCPDEIYRGEAPCENCKAHHKMIQRSYDATHHWTDKYWRTKYKLEVERTRADDLVTENLKLRKRPKEAFVFGYVFAFLVLAALVALSML